MPYLVPVPGTILNTQRPIDGIIEYLVHVIATQHRRGQVASTEILPGEQDSEVETQKDETGQYFCSQLPRSNVLHHVRTHCEDGQVLGGGFSII